MNIPFVSLVENKRSGPYCCSPTELFGVVEVDLWNWSGVCGVGRGLGAENGGVAGNAVTSDLDRLIYSVDLFHRMFMNIPNRQVDVWNRGAVRDRVI